MLTKKPLTRRGLSRSPKVVGYENLFKLRGWVSFCSCLNSCSVTACVLNLTSCSVKGTRCMSGDPAKNLYCCSAFGASALACMAWLLVKSNMPGKKCNWAWLSANDQIAGKNKNFVFLFSDKCHGQLILKCILSVNPPWYW